MRQHGTLDQLTWLRVFGKGGEGHGIRRSQCIPNVPVPRDLPVEAANTFDIPRNILLHTHFEDYVDRILGFCSGLAEESFLRTYVCGCCNS